MICALVLLAVAHAANIPFWNDYTATLMSTESSDGQMTIFVARNPTSNRATVVSGTLNYSSPLIAAEVANVTFLSDVTGKLGVVFQSNKFENAPAQCFFAFNESMGLAFDLSSTGWLGHRSTTARPLASGGTLYTIQCGGVFDANYTFHSFNNAQCVTIDVALLSTVLQIGVNSTMSLIVSSSGIPVQLQLEGPGSFSLYTFLSFKPLRRPAPPVSVDEACLTGNRCSNNSVALKVQLYRQHGNSTLFKQLNNTNLASLVGEAFWLCTVNSPSTLLSLYELTVDGRWSDFSYCSAGICSTRGIASVRGVGRQFNDGNATCDFVDNSEPDDNGLLCYNGYCPGGGAYYSFPAPGACPLGSPLGTNGCVWQQDYKTVKTITVQCLYNVSYDFYNCNNQTLGFMASELKRAFQLCPDVQGSVGDEISAEEFHRTAQAGPSI